MFGNQIYLFMKKLVLVLSVLFFVSCSDDNDDKNCRCQAETDVASDVFVEKKCEDLTQEDIDAALLYAGTELGANYVYTDTATTICD